MLNHYDIAYALALAVSSPVWLLKPSARRKVFAAFAQRMGQVPQRDPSRPAIMIHAVSVGEINAARQLIQRLATLRRDLHLIISTTTKTGHDRARELYGQNANITVIRYPLDFTRGIHRCLDKLRPDIVVLLELEIWPNFIRQCEKRGIPVVLVNGRLTSSSYRNYRLISPFIRPTFARLSAVCVQDDLCAQRMTALGAKSRLVQVTGTMKFDTAEIAEQAPGATELAASLCIRRGEGQVWVCGSTGPGEEQIVLHCYRQLLERVPRLRLVIVPRKPERFDEAAQLIRDAGFTVIRRSHPESSAQAEAARQSVLPPIILGDTMGELRKFYSLADVVFVGRSLVDLGPRQHGSDMIEPAALRRPTIIGPYTSNFAEVVNRFMKADAMIQVHDQQSLTDAVATLLSSPQKAREMAGRAQMVVRASQGATDHHAAIILECLDSSRRRSITVFKA